MKPIKRIPRIIAMLIAIVMLPFGFFLEGNNAFAEQKEYVYRLNSSKKSIEIYDFDGKHIVNVAALESDALHQAKQRSKTMRHNLTTGEPMNFYPDSVEFTGVTFYAKPSFENDTNIFDIDENGIITPLEESWTDSYGEEHNGKLSCVISVRCHYYDMAIAYSCDDYVDYGYEFTVKIQKKYNFYNPSLTLSNRELTTLNIFNSPGTLEDCKNGEITINQNGIPNTIKTGESAIIAEWSSMDTSIATVDKYGNVSAIENGKTIITANIFRISPTNDVDNKTHAYYSLSKVTSSECEIVVDLYHINKTSIIFNDSESYQLCISNQPKQTLWTSSDKNVCVVDKNGLVTPISNGKAKIFCISGELTFECEVTVDIKPHINNEDIIFDNINETEQLTVLYSSDSFLWISGDESVAVVNDNGVVKSTGVGKTVIYAISSSGVRYECNIECLGNGILKNKIGDINNDSEINISDAVLLQKYLLGAQKFTKEQYEAADINKDGSTDAFDMVSMRQLLISQ